MSQKCYFLSDAHLGSLAYDNNRSREQKLCRFLRWAAQDATDIFLVGDIFDFWYEYRYVVPKGHVRLLGCLAELADRGIRLHFFIGNHDIWTYGYLADEIGMTVYRDAAVMQLGGSRFYIAHGDRTGYRPWHLKLLHAFFHSNWIRKIYNTLHPWFNMRLGLSWSRYNRRHKHRQEEAAFWGEDREYLVQFAKNYNEQPIDYFVFGHRHVMLDLMLTQGRRVVYLGDWIDKFSYGVFDENGFRLEIFEADESYMK